MKKLQDFVREVSALSTVPTGDVKEFTETLGIYSILAYSSGQDIEIPMLGTLKIKYLGDEIVPQGRRAKLETEFIPDPFLVRCIGQVEDKEETDAERLYRDKIERLLQSHG